MSDYSQALEMQVHTQRQAAAMLALGLSPNAIKAYTEQEHILRTASTFWMSSDIGDAVATAADTLPLDVPLRPSVIVGDWPTGFLWCAKPWHVPNFGKHEPVLQQLGTVRTDEVCGLHWQFANGVLAVEAYSQARIEGQWTYVGPFVVGGRRLPDDVTIRDACAGADHQSATMRLVISTLLWLRQRIVVATPARADRATRRRLAVVGDDRDVIYVIHLRRAEHAPVTGDSVEVEWSCRWVVRGHWRNQFHPSTGHHEPTWIYPHVKGPDDKPLRVPGATIYAVDR
jgi:hypothetical protein